MEVRLRQVPMKPDLHRAIEGPKAPASPPLAEARLKARLQILRSRDGNAFLCPDVLRVFRGNSCDVRKHNRGGLLAFEKSVDMRVKRSKNLKQQAKQTSKNVRKRSPQSSTKDHHFEVRADGREKNFSRASCARSWP